jgi:hypothetical protein
MNLYNENKEPICHKCLKLPPVFVSMWNSFIFKKMTSRYFVVFCPPREEISCVLILEKTNFAQPYYTNLGFPSLFAVDTCRHLRTRIMNLQIKVYLLTWKLPFWTLFSKCEFSNSQIKSPQKRRTPDFKFIIT